MTFLQWRQKRRKTFSKLIKSLIFLVNAIILPAYTKSATRNSGIYTQLAEDVFASWRQKWLQAVLNWNFFRKSLALNSFIYFSLFSQTSVCNGGTRVASYVSDLAYLWFCQFDIFKHKCTQNVLKYDHHLCCLQWLEKTNYWCAEIKTSKNYIGLVNILIPFSFMYNTIQYLARHPHIE